ncbi:MAG: nitroreductase [Clostridiales bacterium]|nr:nitroreductase [Clostridiales bacterium]
MSLLEIMQRRYSVRKYTNQKVEEEKIQKILEAARIAPTAANLQPVKIFVIQSEEGIKKIEKAANVYQAPLAVLVCADREKAWKRPFDGMITTDIDASIVTDHMMLEATEQGLGSVWICYFDPDVIKKEFEMPDGLEPVNILAIGYADDAPAAPDRHKTMRVPMEKLVEYC